MGQFETTPIRNETDDVLVSAGLEWNEYSPGLPRTLSKVFLPLGVAGLMAIFFQPFLGVLLIVASVGAFFTISNNFRQPRSLIFEQNGDMRVPHGMPFGNPNKGISGHHDNIVSIEATGRTYNIPDADDGWQKMAVNVALISKGGDTVYVSRDLTIEQARSVAVKLTQALEALRTTTANDRQGPSLGVSGSDDDDMIE